MPATPAMIKINVNCKNEGFLVICGKESTGADYGSKPLPSRSAPNALLLFSSNVYNLVIRRPLVDMKILHTAHLTMILTVEGTSGAGPSYHS